MGNECQSKRDAERKVIRWNKFGLCVVNLYDVVLNVPRAAEEGVRRHVDGGKV